MESALIREFLVTLHGAESSRRSIVRGCAAVETGGHDGFCGISRPRRFLSTAWPI